MCGQWLRNKNARYDAKYNWPIHGQTCSGRASHTIWHRLQDLPAKTAHYGRVLLIKVGLRKTADWLRPHQREFTTLLFTGEILDAIEYNRAENRALREEQLLRERRKRDQLLEESFKKLDE